MKAELESKIYVRISSQTQSNTFEYHRRVLELFHKFGFKETIGNINGNTLSIHFFTEVPKTLDKLRIDIKTLFPDKEITVVPIDSEEQQNARIALSKKSNHPKYQDKPI